MSESPPRFFLRDTALDVAALADALSHPGAGGYCSFEGRVRDVHRGRAVLRLDYEAYTALAVREGERVVAEALERFDILDARAAHRTGTLAIGEVAVWIGVIAAHRDAAFAACRFLIDDIKRRVPIWKREHFADGETVWVHPGAEEAASR